ncbi:MAG: hypothetical protein WDW38_001188 [Sanguina aurantia]
MRFNSSVEVQRLQGRLIGSPAFIMGDPSDYPQPLQTQINPLSAYASPQTWDPNLNSSSQSQQPLPPLPSPPPPQSQSAPSECGNTPGLGRLSHNAPQLTRSPSGALGAHGSAVGVGGGIGPLARNSRMAASFTGLHHPDLGQHQLDRELMGQAAAMIGDDEDPDRLQTCPELVHLWALGIIRPHARTRWDAFLVLLLLWVLFVSPVILCFGVEHDFTKGDAFGIIEFIINVLFVIDMSLNFRTAYYNRRGLLIVDRGTIARRYLRTWFLIDLLSVIPYDQIFDGSWGFLSMLKLVRVLRISRVISTLQSYRLSKIIRLPRIVQKVEALLENGVLQTSQSGSIKLCTIHLAACLFYYMALVNGSGPGTWVGAMELTNASLGERYLNSVYWAVTTATTVGYGDITPKSKREKVVAVLTMLAGVSLVGYVTSSITSLMAIKNSQSTHIAVKKQVVADILVSRSVPSELSQKVSSFVSYSTTKLVREEEEKLLSELPLKLRSRLLQHIYGDVLSRMPAFQNLRYEVFFQVVSRLQVFYFVPGDIVTLQGDYVNHLFFVAEGKLEVRSYDFDCDTNVIRTCEAVNQDELTGVTHTAVGRLRPQHCFGHAGCLHETTWPATVIALTCCEVYGLSSDGLRGLLEAFPEMEPLMELPPPLHDPTQRRVRPIHLSTRPSGSSDAPPPPPTSPFTVPVLHRASGSSSWIPGTLPAPDPSSSPLSPVSDPHIIARDFPHMDLPQVVSTANVQSRVIDALKGLGSGLGAFLTQIAGGEGTSGFGNSGGSSRGGKWDKGDDVEGAGSGNGKGGQGAGKEGVFLVGGQL